MMLTHAVAAAPLTLASSLTSCAATASVPPSLALAWKPCGQGARCAALTVPADWHAPRGATTRLNVVKRPAKDQAHKRGPLVINLGSGATAAALLGNPPKSIADLTKHSDVVAFAPPGLGGPQNGTLIRCPRPAPPVDGLVRARTAAQWRAHENANAAYDRGCRSAAGPAYRGLNSWQIAHDIDALRAALGTPRLRYFGNSYGTAYGQAYAELFGRRVARMYLEGVTDHTRPHLRDWLRTYAVTQERQLTHFRAWCAKDTPCALHGTDAARVWDRLVARAPLPAPGLGSGKTVSANRLFAGRWWA